MQVEEVMPKSVPFKRLVSESSKGHGSWGEGSRETSHGQSRKVEKREDRCDGVGTCREGVKGSLETERD